MRVLAIETAPLHRQRFVNAAPRGRGAVSAVLPIVRARVDALPASLDALVLASDLQGVVFSPRFEGQSVLLGVELAGVLFDLAEEGVLPEAASTGVILAGDLYSAPSGDLRGATGDVRDVWLTFALTHRWVAGVGGNYDLFGDPGEQRRFEASERIHLLDGSVVDLDGLRIGGVSYVMGDPNKAGRREPDDFLAALELVLEQRPDILVLHEGPSGHAQQRGNLEIRARIAARPPPLVVCGHVHWDEPLATIGTSQVVNVDGRALVLSRD
jgi:Icc-related predicted phosphoesterase